MMKISRLHVLLLLLLLLLGAVLLLLWAPGLGAVNSMVPEPPFASLRSDAAAVRRTGSEYEPTNANDGRGSGSRCAAGGGV